MLVRVGHAVNLSTCVFEEFLAVLRGASSVRHIQALLHRGPLFNLVDPFLQGGELGEVNLKGTRAAAHPGEVGNVGDGVLGTRQVRALLQTGFKHRV